MNPPAAERIGLCSVTLRAQPAEKVLAVAIDAGLRLIEWGADVHAPPGATGLADLGAITRAHGLQVCSYGSYWRAGVTPVEDIVTLVDSARALGTSRIRMWAGTTGASSTSGQQRKAIVTQIRQAAQIAAAHSCEIAFEFHGDTLTDSVQSTLRLLDEVDQPNVSTYWQPPIDVDDNDALDGLLQLVDRVSAVHVFSWWPGQERRPLDYRRQLWRGVLTILADNHSTADLLLEFVPNDDPALVHREATTLRSIAEAAG